MLAIPSEIQALLKSKVMIGENRPTATMTIDGQPAQGDLVDPTTWTTWRAFTTSGRSNGNIAETNDGRCIVAYVEAGKVYLAYAPTVLGILNGTEVFDYANAIEIYDDGQEGQCACSINMVDGKFLMCIVHNVPNEYPAGPWPNYDGLHAEFYRDTDGNGNGMAYVSTILSSWRCQGAGFLPSFVQKLGDGTLVVGHAYGYNYGHEGLMHRSYDNGATWQHINDPSGYYLGHTTSMRFLMFGDSAFASTVLNSNGSMLFNYFYNSGANVTTYGWGDGWGSIWSTPCRTAWEYVGKDLIMADCPASWSTIRIWRLKAQPPDVGTNCRNKDDWENIVDDISSDDAWSATALTLASHALICQHSTGSVISGAGTTLNPAVTVPVKSVSVNRSKGSASQATVVLDNKDGVYAPDNSLSKWFQIIWPNKVIEITMGYGTAQQLVFTGMIDDVDMETYPAELTITARDMSKRALDQKVRLWWVDHWAYTVVYQYQTLEYIFNDLALKAGWDPEKIHTEATGLTLEEVKFTHETYADAFQRLCELATFEWFCDEFGDIYFRKAVEPAPVAVYVCKEGEDIFKLGYRFSDAEIYAGVVVYSKDTAGKFLRTDLAWSAADYNKLLPGKIMIIDATDLASTAEQVAVLAQEACDAMNSKPREVSFVLVGNAYLQLGDCLQVIESSTTISELYRVFDFTHELDSQGTPIFGTTIKCYHYANVA